MSESYLKHAEQAEEWARQATAPGEREAFQQIAALWRSLAKQRAERDTPEEE